MSKRKSILKDPTDFLIVELVDSDTEKKTYLRKGTIDLTKEDEETPPLKKEKKESELLLFMTQLPDLFAHFIGPFLNIADLLILRQCCKSFAQLKDKISEQLKKFPFGQTPISILAYYGYYYVIEYFLLPTFWKTLSWNNLFQKQSSRLDYSGILVNDPYSKSDLKSFVSGSQLAHCSYDAKVYCALGPNSIKLHNSFQKTKNASFSHVHCPKIPSLSRFYSLCRSSDKPIDQFINFNKFDKLITAYINSKSLQSYGFASEISNALNMLIENDKLEAFNTLKLNSTGNTFANALTEMSKSITIKKIKLFFDHICDHYITFSKIDDEYDEYGNWDRLVNEIIERCSESKNWESLLTCIFNNDRYVALISTVPLYPPLHYFFEFDNDNEDTSREIPTNPDDFKIMLDKFLKIIKLSNTPKHLQQLRVSECFLNVLTPDSEIKTSESLSKWLLILIKYDFCKSLSKTNHASIWAWIFECENWKEFALQTKEMFGDDFMRIPFEWVLKSNDSDSEDDDEQIDTDAVPMNLDAFSNTFKSNLSKYPKFYMETYKLTCICNILHFKLHICDVLGSWAKIFK